MRVPFLLIFCFAACTGELVGDDPDGAVPDGGTVDAPMLDTRADSGADVGEDYDGGVDAGVDAMAPLATCATVADFVDGAAMCRDEAARCSLTISSTSCAAACEAMNLDCLRAYDEATACMPALEQSALACDAVPEASGFCQCGDGSAVYDPWVVVTIGDSTMSNRGQIGDEWGWGDALPMFGVRSDDVINEGSSGASSLDFETRSNWPRAEALLGPDVFLLIQFGHNDGSDDVNRRTNPGEAPDYEGTYHDRLGFYVAAARAAGATPVIMTSVGHMLFDGDGVARDTGVTNYANAAIAYARSEGLMLFDGHRVTRAEYTRLGPTETLAQYSFDEVTHFSPEGAIRVAELMARTGCIESELFCAQFTLPE